MEWLRAFMLPDQGSQHARNVDTLFMALFWLNVFFFVLVAGLAIYCVWAFKRREGVKTPHVTHNLALELLWSVIPTIMVIGIFFWGAAGYMDYSVAPGDSMEIAVTAKKWNWTFTMPDGSVWGQRIQIPVNKNVKFIMTSNDVLHDFYIPNMRVKHDVIPNRYTEVWFKAEKEGEYHVACAEYCGKSHSDMWAKIKVVSQAEYENWLTNGPPEWDKMPPAELGKIAYEAYGCNTCHSVDGSKNTGPTWKGLYGKTEKFTDGSTVVVDDAYLQESINQPGKRVVSGYENQMPNFEGQIKPKLFTGLIAYIKSLK
jgi:cytochrome c oxidase subunit 2